jgi:hypothetical protein
VISWRYHVVSIVAVILAFGLGILAGTSVVGDRFAADLRLNYKEAIRERDEALDTVGFYERFAEGLGPALRDDTLAGERAVVVTMDGVDGPARRVVEDLSAAGVEVLATLTLTRKLADPKIQENATVLQGILGVSGSDPETLRAGVADVLAVRLAGGALAEEDDVLGGLLAGGFVTADRDLEPDALLGVGGAGQLVVIAAGGPVPTELPGPDALLVPFTERLVRLDVAAAAAGPTEDPYGFISAIRDASSIPDCSIVTVDDIDFAGVGGITLAMAIDQLLADADPAFLPGGDYGIRGDSIVPGTADPPDSCRR